VQAGVQDDKIQGFAKVSDNEKSINKDNRAIYETLRFTLGDKMVVLEWSQNDICHFEYS
jgi:hypothetical protein